MAFLIGEFIGAMLSILLIAPFILIIYLITYNKYDSNEDGLSG